MAYSHWRLGHRADADTLYLKAIAVMAAGLGDSHPWTAVTRTNLARVRLESGRTAEAAALARRSLDDLTTAFPVGHSYTARPALLLAEIALDRGRPEEAAQLIARADTLTAASPPAGGDRVAVGLLMARGLRRAGHGTRANALLDSLQALVSGAGSPAPDLLARIAAAR
jgi:hypothetical protein